MNEMMEKVKGTLRSMFERDSGEVRAACWVPKCKTPPAMVLAGTEDGIIAGCREHARRWVTSDACRIAADSGGRHTIEALERWAEEHGPYAALIGAKPSNDVPFLRVQPAER